MIRHAKISEIKDILNITKACAIKMSANGIFQWNDNYPSESAFLNDLERNELYVKENNGRVIGIIVISTIMDEEYAPIQWLTPNGNSTYIHRLGVDPVYQGKGFAQELMDYAEAYSKSNGFTSVRLDTFSQNKGIKGFMSKEVIKN